MPRPARSGHGAGAARQQVVYGPETFHRDKGTPVTVADTFAVAWPVAACRLIVDNGVTAAQLPKAAPTREGDSQAPCARVSSATIDLNDERVFGQRDFNQQVAHLERPVEVLPDNRLAVRLTSAPGSCFTLTIVCGDGNHLPLADAGLDQTLAVGAVAQLDGGGSSDADGDALTFEWALDESPAGSASALSDPTAFNPTLPIDRPGSYLLSLIVNDGLADSAPDTVRIDTRNSAPAADAGEDSSARVSDTLVLDGSGSFDVDGDLLRFDWTFLSQPTGSTAVLSDPTAVNPSFILDRYGDYELALTVSDGLADSAPDTVRVSTLNSPPVANAGPDQTGQVGDTITLDGSASTDVDGDRLSYRWSLVGRPAESLAALSDPTAVQPDFALDWPGTYLAQLIVNDGALDSAPDSITVITEGSRPVAEAGPDQSAPLGDTVTLDGTGSRDADQDALTYAWSLIAVPEGSAAVLIAPDSAGPSFQLDLPGTYVAQLIVNDGALDSAPDTVTITTENSRPVACAGRDQTASVDATVLLDGTGSSDADGDPLAYQWSLLSVPDGSASVLDGADTDTASLVPDRAGPLRRPTHRQRRRAPERPGHRHRRGLGPQPPAGHHLHPRHRRHRGRCPTATTSRPATPTPTTP